MSIMKGKQQQQAAEQRGLPVEVVSDAQRVVPIPAETIQFEFYSAGVLTTDAGEAAGTVVVGKLANGGVLNAVGDVVGHNNDTSFAFGTGTILTTRVDFPYLVAENFDENTGTLKADAITAGFANGEWCMDHRTGTAYGVKDTNGTSDTGTYKISVQQASSGGGVSGDVNLKQLQGTEINLDDAAFAVGVDAVLPTGFLADETATDSVDEGDTGIARMTLDRRQIVAGQTLDDAAFGVGTEHVQAVGLLADETTTDSVDEGDIGLPRMTLARKAIGASDFLEDTAHVDADYGTHMLTVRDDSPVAKAGTDGDYQSLTTDDVGALWQRGREFDPGTGAAKSFEITAIWNKHEGPTLADVTNETNATTNYSVDLEGFDHLTIQFEKTGGTDSVTLTVNGSLLDDGTPAASVPLQDITQYGLSIQTAAATAASYTADAIISLIDATNYKFIDIQTVSAGGNNDADYQIIIKKWYS